MAVINDGTNTVTPLSDPSTWTWINQGNATVTKTPFGFTLEFPATSNADNMCALALPVGSTYTVVACVRNLVFAKDYTQGGIVLWDNVGNKGAALTIRHNHLVDNNV